ncbi:basic proline-rich protein-like [Hyaena hyaena]|uniref:basic proline-rich protein-like n=1 Tax=Hyaena hyaena TaxID=95912 RepID=UPI001924A977|nr:basic proline-rich protein-like [Hyaena hyaena]
MMPGTTEKADLRGGSVWLPAPGRARGVWVPARGPTSATAAGGSFSLLDSDPLPPEDSATALGHVYEAGARISGPGSWSPGRSHCTGPARPPRSRPPHPAHRTSVGPSGPEGLGLRLGTPPPRSFPPGKEGEKKPETPPHTCLEAGGVTVTKGGGGRVILTTRKLAKRDGGRATVGENSRKRKPCHKLLPPRGRGPPPHSPLQLGPGESPRAPSLVQEERRGVTPCPSVPGARVLTCSQATAATRGCPRRREVRERPRAGVGGRASGWSRSLSGLGLAQGNTPGGVTADGAARRRGGSWRRDAAATGDRINEEKPRAAVSATRPRGARCPRETGTEKKMKQVRQPPPAQPGRVPTPPSSPPPPECPAGLTGDSSPGTPPFLQLCTGHASAPNSAPLAHVTGAAGAAAPRAPPPQEGSSADFINLTLARVSKDQKLKFHLVTTSPPPAPPATAVPGSLLVSSHCGHRIVWPAPAGTCAGGEAGGPAELMCRLHAPGPARPPVTAPLLYGFCLMRTLPLPAAPSLMGRQATSQATSPRHDSPHPRGPSTRPPSEAPPPDPLGRAGEAGFTWPRSKRPGERPSPRARAGRARCSAQVAGPDPGSPRKGAGCAERVRLQQVGDSLRGHPPEPSGRGPPEPASTEARGKRGGEEGAQAGGPSPTSHKLGFSVRRLPGP